MKKIYVSMLMMFLFFCVSPGIAAATPWDGTADTTWYTEAAEGTTSFEISTPAQLAGLASIVNAGTDTFAGKTVKLTADLDLGGTESNGVWSGQKWTAIGLNAANKQFAGTFDGNGKTIAKLYIDATTQCQGLFGYVSAAGRIKNFSIVSGYIKSTAGDIGGIAGYCYGYILNCGNAATVAGGGSNIGGIAGSFAGSGWLLNSFNTGDVKGNSSSLRYVGGLVGNFGSNGGIQNCYNLGNLSDFGLYGGGLTSQIANGTITNCYNAGTVTAASTTYVANCIGRGNNPITRYTNVYGLKTATINASLPAMTNPSNAAFETSALKDSNALAATASSLGSGFKAPSGSAAYPQLIWENGGVYPADEIEGIAIASASAENGKVTLVMNKLLNYTILDKSQFALTATSNGGEAKPVTINSVSQSSSAGSTTVTVNFTAIPAGTGEQSIVMSASYLGGNAITAAAFQIAQSTEWPAYGVAPASGDGTAVAPYLLASAENLAWFAGEVNGGKNALCAKLTTDIDLEGKTWVSIGPKNYTGIFDGDGHVIKNMTLNGSDVALFGYIKSGGFVKNLGIASGTVTGSSNAGGIAVTNAGVILNCYNKATISANYYGGGIAGTCPGGIIIGCYNSGTVNATTAGGITSLASNSAAKLMNVYNTGKIIAPGSQSGGIVGNMTTGILQNAYNTGDVVAAGAAPGGIIGYRGGCTVSNCYYLQTSVASNEIDGTTVVSSGDMKALAPTMGSSFVADSQNINSGYPIFSWQATGTYPADELEGLAITSLRAENGKVYVTLNKQLTYRTLAKGDFSLETRLADGDYEETSITGISNDHSGEKSIITLSFEPYGETIAEQSGYVKVAYLEQDAVEEEMNIAPSMEWKLYDAGGFNGGDGSQEAPYQIANEEQLVYLSNQVALGVSYEGEYFVLTADLQLGERYWYPIGSYGTTDLTALPFAGHFDGQNHTLHNIYIPLTGTTGARYSYSGIFGWNTGSISNLRVTGFIQGDAVGGLVAINSGTVKNCVNYANLQKQSTNTNVYVGGIASQNSGDIVDCLNYGNISGTNPSTNFINAGGIVGTTGSGESKEATVSRCANYGTIIGYSDLGGIAADANSRYKVTISECFNAGRIVASASRQSNYGGIVGYSSEYAVITNCYNTSDIAGMNRYVTNAGSGGITAGTGGHITNCYNVGSLGILQGSGAHIMGSSIGAYSSFTNCYYLNDGFYCGVRDRQGEIMDDAYGIQAMEAEDMRSEDFVAQLNGADGTAFVADSADVNNGYPILAWAAAQENTSPSGLKGGENKISGLDAEKRYEYKDVNSVNYTAVAAGSTEITGLDCGSYNVRFMEDSENAPSDYVIVDVSGDLKGTVTVFAGENSYKGKYYAFTEGIPLNSDVSYQWFRYDDDSDKYTRIYGATDRIYSPQAKDIGYYLYVEVYVDGCDDRISGTGSSVVGKYTIPSDDFTAVDCSTEANNDGKITGLDPDFSYEYKLSSENDYTAVADGTTEITGLVPGVYDLRGKTTELYTSSVTSYTIDDFTTSLANAKTGAKADLEDALASYTEEEYSTENWTALNTARTGGDAAIDAATSVANVAEAKETALAAMAAIPSLADATAAQTVMDQIAALPMVDALTLENKDAVTEAHNAYDALTKTQQELVTNRAALEAAEAKIKALEDAQNADEAAAQNVTDQIAALPAAGELTLNDKDTVAAARTAYTALTETQQALVTNLAVLEAAEAKIKALEDEENTDEEAAQEVVNQIAALRVPEELSLSDKNAVTTARTVYETLTTAQKALVTNLGVLEAAEARIKALEEEETPVSDVKNMTDVKSGAWYYNDVSYVLAKGIVKGTTPTTFEPDSNITRGQFVTILGRYAGVADSSTANPIGTKFGDVNANTYYAAHVAWALESGVTLGTSDTTFEPELKISRQDMATLIARFAEKMGITLPDGSKAALFADDDQIAAYAKTAVYSMVEAEIINGVGHNKFDPIATATRAQAAKMMALLVTYGK